VKNIDSLNFESAREENGHGVACRRYVVEAKISLSWSRLDRRQRIAG